MNIRTASPLAARRVAGALAMAALLCAATAAADAQHPDTARVACGDTLPMTLTDIPCGMTLLVRGPRVIRTAAELRALFVRHHGPCDSSAIPEIDFDRYTLIGRWVTLGNCPAGQRFSVTVCRDDSARVYRHVLELGYSPCRGLMSHMSWILVPKLPDGYEVVFEERWDPERRRYRGR